jgi:hypothetical protein
VGTHRSVSQRAGDVVRSPFFSRAVALSNVVDDYVKGYHIRGLSARSIHMVYVDWHGKRTYRVYQVSPVWYISIRIIVTLGYE